MVTRQMVDQTTVDQILGNWEDKPRETARQMIQKYGLPDEVSSSMLIWYNNGPWKKTIVHNEQVPHRFPKPHTDFLEQVIDYRVPPDKADDLLEFDGSVLFDRTKGEIAARCDQEPMNILALNLAYDIINGKRSVEEARNTYAQAAMAAMQKQPAPLTERLQFEVPRGGTADLDEPASAMMGITGERMGETMERGGVGVAEREEIREIERTININAPVERVFQIWANYENFPRFLSHVKEVRRTDEQRSHWKVTGPLGTSAEWDAILTEFIPNQVIAWRTVPGSDVEHSGRVLFQPNMDGTTRVDVRLAYKKPAGGLGQAIASLFGADPEKQLDDDLRRMKDFIERGEGRTMGTQM